MSELLTEHAVLRCSKGILIMPLKVVSQQIYKINGFLVATEMDKLPMVNIPCFGVCMMGSYPPPCVPIPIVWENTSKQSSINNLKVLTKDSTIKCAMGGTISVIIVPQIFTKET